MNSFFLMIMMVLLQYSLDPTKHECNTLYSRSILLFHHMISIYILFGGILFHPLYHALFCIGILIHWYSNNNRCEITIITNRECGIDIATQFKDYLQTLGISKLYPNIHWFLLPLLILVDIYKLRQL